jgi:hypothetical protein
MFAVEITDDAKAALETELHKVDAEKACVLIYREGPTGDVSRTNDGSTIWKIERPTNPWRFEIVCFTTPEQPEYQIIGGIRFYLNLIPRKDEKGILIRLKNGKPIIEPLGT